MKASSILSPLLRGYEKLSSLAAHAQSPLLLAIRLYWGWQFFVTGKGKLLHLGDTAAFFKELSIPFPMANAFAAGATECFGGILLMAGLASRAAAIPLIVTMVIAYLTADMEAVKGVLTDPDAFVTAAPFLFLLASLLVLVFGPGALAVEHFLSRRAGTRSPVPGTAAI